MDLLLQVRPPETSPVDVRVEVEAIHTCGDLIEALVSFLGLADRDWDAAVMQEPAVEPLRPDVLVIGESGLVSGDQIFLLSEPLPQPSATHLRAASRLVVTSGSGAGQSFELPNGTHVVGRDRSRADIVLQEPSMSAEHFSLEISDQGVWIVPISEPTNGLRLNGVEVNATTPVGFGDVIQAGSSRLEVRANDKGTPRATGRSGQIALHRQPYFPLLVEHRTFEALGDLPIRPAPPRSAYLMATLPIALGLIAAMIGGPRFLLLFLFSPIVAIAQYLDRGKLAAKSYQRELERFRQRLDDRFVEVKRTIVDELARRNSNSPDLLVLADWARERSNRLWARGRETDNFMSIRVGVGLLPPSLVIEPETGGDIELRVEVADAMADANSLIPAPVSIDLASLGTVSIVGSSSQVEALATTIAVQVTCLHSPEDLVIFSAVSSDLSLNDYLKWLPHVDALSSPLGEPSLTSGFSDASELFRSLVLIAEERASRRTQDLDTRWPWALLFVDASLRPEGSSVARLLEVSMAAGIAVVWLAEDVQQVPRQARALINIGESSTGAVINYTDPARDSCEFVPDLPNPSFAHDIGRALAPLSDASARHAVASIPRVATLFDSLGVERVSSEWVVGNWQTDRGYSLVAPIGLNDKGPVFVDIVKHGPNCLIGGTSGSGKTELIYSLVANLAAYNSPERLNLLFLERGMGALGQSFASLPHYVGSIGDLDSELAHRVLTSLHAEMDRRIALFDLKGVADLGAMLERFPAEAPASLLIVIDEFAALVATFPQFVEEIASLGARGRSLGIHLLLSTQQPSSSISDGMLRQTSLRISLRALDPRESSNLIGSSDAALIPRPLRGRGYVRLGGGGLVAFQSAWGGAPFLGAKVRQRVSIEPFDAIKPDLTNEADKDVEQLLPFRTQRDELIGAIVRAADSVELASIRRPWREALPAVIDLLGVLDAEGLPVDGLPGQNVTIGMIDDVDAQRQYPARLCLEDQGAAVIFGNAGSGKTTALRSIAVSAAVRDHELGGRTLSIFALDFASRELGVLRCLPQCGIVAMNDDLEAVTRLVELLHTQLERRLARAGEALTSGAQAPLFTRILLLIDGYEHLARSFESSLDDVWTEKLSRLIMDGRRVGLNVVLATNRPESVGFEVLRSLSNRVVLRQSVESDYPALGVPQQEGRELRPGQAINQAGKKIQIATLVSDGGNGQRVDEGKTLLALAESLDGAVAQELVSVPLPAQLDIGTARATVGTATDVIIGIEDISLAPVELRLQHDNVAFVGPRRSGRSSALTLVGMQLVASGWEVWIAGARSDRPIAIDGAACAAFGSEEISSMLESLAASLDGASAAHRALLFDDVDRIEDPSIDRVLNTILEGGVRCVGSVSSLNGFRGILRELRASRTKLFLQPDNHDVRQAISMKSPIRPGIEMVPGRGVLIDNQSLFVLQVPWHEALDGKPLPTPTTELTLINSDEKRRDRPKAMSTTKVAGAGSREALALVERLAQLLSVKGSDPPSDPPNRSDIDSDLLVEMLLVLRDSSPELDHISVLFVDPASEPITLYPAAAIGDPTTDLAISAPIAPDSKSSMAEVLTTAKSITLEERDVAKILVPIVRSRTVVGIIHGWTSQVGLDSSDLLATKMELAAPMFALSLPAESLWNAAARYIAEIDHQVATPLSAALRSLNELAAAPGETTSREVQRVRTLVAKSARALRQGQYFSRLEAGRPNEAAIAAWPIAALAELVRSCVDMANLAAGSGVAKIALDCPNVFDNVIVRYDADLIELALASLLENAQRYSFGGEIVRVSLRANGEGTAIDVRNRGLELHESELAAVFERGWRGANAALVTSDGSGIGLYLAARVANAHDAQLTAHATNDEGVTRFSFVLPMADGIAPGA